MGGASAAVTFREVAVAVGAHPQVVLCQTTFHPDLPNEVVRQRLASALLKDRRAGRQGQLGGAGLEADDLSIDSIASISGSIAAAWRRIISCRSASA